MKTCSVLGIMSGTSIDSVDYALCDISDARIHLRQYWQTPLPKSLRRQLHRAAAGDASSHETGQLHHDLGRFFARHAQRAGVRPHLVGMHGQTVFHRSDKTAPATLQIGEPAYLHAAFAVPVISNFRAADIAAGGQGAPLATLFHLRVFSERGRHVCIQNLGGIGNVTSIDGTRSKTLIRSFDTGPGNMLIDLAIDKLSGGELAYDRDGRWARRGTVCDELVKRWLRHPFFQLAPPKSTGREEFGESFFAQAWAQCRKRHLSKYDVAAAFTAFTARAVALNYRRHLSRVPDRLILTGGGAKNSQLKQMIEAELRERNPGLQIKSPADYGWPEQSVEPAAFALLAYCRWKKIPGNLPETTGARRPVLLGQMTG